jgi:hypothetical protein
VAARGATSEVRERAAERQRQVIVLRIRGISFESIGRQLGFSKQVAHKLFNRALKALPSSVNAASLKRLEDERIAEMRARLWSELSGREARKPDPENPGRFVTVIVRPEPETVRGLIDGLVRISRHEAMLHGLDGLTKSEIPSTNAGQAFDEEEMARQWERLTPDEQTEFMRLLAKLQARLVEQPPAINDAVSIETTAAPVIADPRTRE